jgi:hypothetical protein
VIHQICQNILPVIRISLRECLPGFCSDLTSERIQMVLDPEGDLPAAASPCFGGEAVGYAEGGVFCVDAGDEEGDDAAGSVGERFGVGVLAEGAVEVVGDVGPGRGLPVAGQDVVAAQEAGGQAEAGVQDAAESVPGDAPVGLVGDVGGGGAGRAGGPQPGGVRGAGGVAGGVVVGVQVSRGVGGEDGVGADERGGGGVVLAGAFSLLLATNNPTSGAAVNSGGLRFLSCW